MSLGLTTDGFNPFGNMSLPYSIWLMVLTAYNLPPWLCMKDSYVMLTLLILGPQALGKDMDLFLWSLINYGWQGWKHEMQLTIVYSQCVLPCYGLLMIFLLEVVFLGGVVKITNPA